MHTYSHSLHTVRTEYANVAKRMEYLTLQVPGLNLSLIKAIIPEALPYLFSLTRRKPGCCVHTRSPSSAVLHTHNL
jgi:hypothetical protein